MPPCPIMMLLVSLSNSKCSWRDSTCGCRYCAFPNVSKIFILRHFQVFDSISPAYHKDWFVCLYATCSPEPRPVMVTHPALSDGTYDDEPSRHHIWWSWAYHASSDSSICSWTWFRRWKFGLMSKQITASAVHTPSYSICNLPFTFQ